MEAETSQQMHAWVEFYRDLGVYDFYRRGEPQGSSPVEVVEDATISAAEQNPQPHVPSEVLTSALPGSLLLRGDIFPQAVPSAPAVPNPDQHAANMEAMAPRLVSFNELAAMPAERVPATARASALAAIQEEIGDCTRCPLAYGGRRKIVFGDGSPNARLVFVGEGPGADEDVQGIPFVGKAGQLLNNMIAAMGVERADVYIANIVKCRPPANRVPEPIEANTCAQFLLRQIDVVQPQVIVALGATAAIYLLGVKQPLSALRGQWHSCRGAKLAVTYHPAFLLRDPRQKAEAWKDLQRVMGELGLTPPARK